MAGYRERDGRVPAEEAGVSVTAAGEPATGIGGGNSPGSLNVSWEAAPRGVRSLTRAVLVHRLLRLENLHLIGEESKGGHAWGRRRNKPKQNRSGAENETNAGVYGGVVS